MDCFCCKRMNRETCLCRGPTCRTCLRCEAHCQCIQKPKGPVCAKPKPLTAVRLTSGQAPTA
jgi:hypothetical protein